MACFDTNFHADLPDVARILPIPKALQSEGVQRYGFHGLSCESIVHQLAHDLPERLVIAHLGNGASVTAVRDGRSMDTSMGLTPTGGVVMSTRSGDLDPGVLIYLLREKKLDAPGLEELVDHRSGLFGISGIGGDMRRLRDVASSNADARLAIKMFCYSVRKQLGRDDRCPRRRRPRRLHRRHRRKRLASPRRDLQRPVVDRRQPQRRAEPIREQSDQRCGLTLRGARHFLA